MQVTHAINNIYKLISFLNNMLYKLSYVIDSTENTTPSSSHAE